MIDRAEDHAPAGWEYWIKPLEVISFDGKKLILHHPGDKDGVFMNVNVWVTTHYGELISELLNEGVKDKIAIEFVNKRKEETDE